MKVTTLIPNGMSMLNLIFGFLSIINSIEGNFINAAFFIFLAAIADGTDGKVARKMHATSDIGVEFDSLADLVSFGVAAGVLIYLYSFSTMAYGIYIPILLIACSALRLARFNVQHEPSHFEGIATPVVGFFVASYIVSGIYIEPHVLAFIFAFISIMMVSNVKYPTFKNASKKVWAGLVLTGIALVALIYFNRIFMLLPFMLYAFIGPFFVKYRRMLR